MWPNCEYCLLSNLVNSNLTLPSKVEISPFNKSRTKAILRIGAHNKEVLDLIICGMLGYF
jgi:hypothetical protein